MSTGKQLAGLLLLTTALTLPGAALAQAAGEPADTGAEAGDEMSPEPGQAVDAGRDAASQKPPEEEQDYEEPEVSIPGGAIVVTGRRVRDITRSSTQVVSVLSTEQIARTGEGDIAGALGRVTGLSVQGQGYVYVRGLGDRYSLALLNGLPLPSPQPLSRVVPLDIFPTNIVASSLVQKTYSPNFPGEFGGGVINLTTRAIPDEPFVKVSAGISGDSQTTGLDGYSYYGGDLDWLGFDDGSRDVPNALRSFFDSGARINEISTDTKNAILKDIIEPNMVQLQKIGNLPPNFSGSITAGTAFDVGDGRLGVVATASIKNNWRNRLISKQFATDVNDLSNPVSDFKAFTTDNRVLFNALLGLGLEIGEHKFRWTNLYIRDSLKQSVLSLGFNGDNGNNEAIQDTAWYERQLIDTQFVGEMKFGGLDVDVRGGFAQTQREAPYEYSFKYFEDPDDEDYAGLYRNTLDGQRSSATVNFSDLTEDLYFGGIDFSYPVLDWATVTVGYAYSDTSRRSEFRSFSVQSSNFPGAFALLQPVYLLGDAIIDFQDHAANPTPYEISINDLNPDVPVVQADLEIHAAYGQIKLEPAQGLTVDVGARYEDAKQSVKSVEVFNTPSAFEAATSLANDYILPAATITYDFDNGLQVRASASKTIARPQFRELIYQPFLDPDTSRLFRGNPELRDSELTNFEARAEYYFGRGNKLSVAGFYKDIKKPIEAYASEADGRVRISYANAPKATLYGGELEFQYNYDMDGLGGWFDSKRTVLVANYTYSNSELKVADDDVTYIFRGNGLDPVRPATNVFEDGVPMTGQSDHLVNLQIGLEDTDQLQQFTLMVNYASKRVISRGFNGLPPIEEDPGLTLDFVARQGVQFGGYPVELKFEARNITGRDHWEYQSNGTDRIEINSYDVGRSFSLSASVEF